MRSVTAAIPSANPVCSPAPGGTRVLTYHRLQSWIRTNRISSHAPPTAQMDKGMAACFRIVRSRLLSSTIVWWSVSLQNAPRAVGTPWNGGATTAGRSFGVVAGADLRAPRRRASTRRRTGRTAGLSVTSSPASTNCWGSIRAKLPHPLGEEARVLPPLRIAFRPPDA